MIAPHMPPIPPAAKCSHGGGSAAFRRCIVRGGVADDMKRPMRRSFASGLAKKIADKKAPHVVPLPGKTGVAIFHDPDLVPCAGSLRYCYRRVT